MQYHGVRCINKRSYAPVYTLVIRRSKNVVAATLVAFLQLLIQRKTILGPHMSRNG